MGACLAVAGPSVVHIVATVGSLLAAVDWETVASEVAQPLLTQLWLLYDHAKPEQKQKIKDLTAKHFVTQLTPQPPEPQV